MNNAAGALLLALGALAAGREVLISRGELIEIGGSFRIPDILEQSGARLREVGTTNRTHLDDYRKALGPDVAAVLTVHRSNFEQRGFVATPEPADLAVLAHEAGLPYLVDVGSGLVVDLEPWGLRGEPRVQDALAAGADLVLFSGDKLLGGPQAGCLAGRREVVARCRRASDRASGPGRQADARGAGGHALALSRPGPRGTRDPGAPDADAGRGGARPAGRPAGRRSAPRRSGAALQPGESAVGGGSFPGAVLPTTLVALDAGSLGPDGLALRLRVGEPSVIARVSG